MLTAVAGGMPRATGGGGFGYMDAAHVKTRLVVVRNDEPLPRLRRRAHAHENAHGRQRSRAAAGADAGAGGRQRSNGAVTGAECVRTPLL